MSFGGGFFGGGESHNTSTSTSLQKTADQRVGVEGGLAGGQVVGAGATVANPGSIATSVGDFSTMTQTITGNKFKVGLSGSDVQGLLQNQNAFAQDLLAQSAKAAETTNAKLANLATTALSSQTGVPADWQKYIVPVGVLVVIGLAIRRKGRVT